MDSKFNQECLKSHNEFREIHGCPPLKLDTSLAEAAQSWAENLVKAGCLQHSQAETYGENLAFRGSTGKVQCSGEQITQMWYEEIRLHDYDHPVPQRSGHFTQVIWKETTHAGFGRAITKDGHSAYVVGRYTPPGNYQGEYKLNVPPPQKSRV